MATYRDTSVLVIGGGSTGAIAAIQAKKLGADVLLVTKGMLGKSGCTPLAQNIAVDTKYTPEEEIRVLARDMYVFTDFLMDQKLGRGFINYSPEMARELEEMGIYYRRRPDGSLYVGFQTESARKQPKYRILAQKMGETGLKVMNILRSQMVKMEIPFLEEMTVTSILTSNGQAVGATFLDYNKGDFVVIRAKAVIVATGNTGWIYTYTTTTKEMTCDGHAVAFRAGADLVNIELSNWHIADVAYPEVPKCWVGHVQILPWQNPPGEWSPQFYDSKGVRFMENHELGNMMEHAKAVSAHLREEGGEYYASMRHVSKEGLEDWWGVYDYLAKLDIDTSKDLIRCAMTAHTSIGGISIGEKAETNVPGLYAAGGVTIHMTIPFCFYTGKLAATNAVKWSEGKDDMRIDENQAAQEEQRVMGLLRTQPKEGYTPSNIKKEIRSIMDRGAFVVKTEEKMRQALADLARVRAEKLPLMRLPGGSRNYNYDWVEALDVHNMLDVCELILNASLTRKESRGSFLREDYPTQDNKNWLKKIVVRMQDGKPHWRMVDPEYVYIRPGENGEYIVREDAVALASQEGAK